MASGRFRSRSCVASDSRRWRSQNDSAGSVHTPDWVSAWTSSGTAVRWSAAATTTSTTQCSTESKSVGARSAVLGMAGVQVQFERLAVFGQASVVPGQSNFLLGDNVLGFFEAGVRYNFGGSREGIADSERRRCLHGGIRVARVMKRWTNAYGKSQLFLPSECAGLLTLGRSNRSLSCSPMRCSSSVPS